MSAAPPPPPPAGPGPDTKAVVRAIEALSTQLRRAVDAYLTPVVEDAEAIDDAPPTAVAADREPSYAAVYAYIRQLGNVMPTSRIDRNAIIWHAVNAALDAYGAAETTTPATTCSAQYHGPERPPTQCIRAAHHEASHHTDESGFHWSDDLAVYPVFDARPAMSCAHRGPHPGFTCAEVDATQPYFRVRWEQEQQPPAGRPPHVEDHSAVEHCPACTWDQQHAPAADEDAQRTTRRASLRNLIDRLDRNGALDFREGALLRQHVETEMRDAETLRVVSSGAHRRADEYEQERDQAMAVLAEVLRLFKPALVNGQYAFYQATDQPIAPEDYQRWSSVVQHDVERPWWKQLDTVRAELAEAQAAIEQVRALHVPRDNGTCAARCYSTGMAPEPSPCPTIRALDGTEQPTTEA